MARHRDREGPQSSLSPVEAQTSRRSPLSPFPHCPHTRRPPHHGRSSSRHRSMAFVAVYSRLPQRLESRVRGLRTSISPTAISDFRPASRSRVVLHHTSQLEPESPRNRLGGKTKLPSSILLRVL